jgi:hypothetical protein
MAGAGAGAGAGARIVVVESQQKIFNNHVFNKTKQSTIGK